MLNNCYTFNELKEKFQWTTNEGSIEKQIRFARNRGVEIEKAFKEGCEHGYNKAMRELDSLNERGGRLNYREGFEEKIEKLKEKYK